MKIDKIEIDGFGKLKNYSLSLESGFNLIFGENESGKSTLCEFLLSMFYGLPNSGKRLRLSEDARKKYKPWDGGAFGGRVYFTHEGRGYILEKTFGASKRSDRARLLSADTWDVCGSGENAGERFFGLGREGFLKTLYIPCGGAEVASGGELVTRLSNMETSGDEDVSYIKIKEALEKEQYAILSKTGKGGKLAALKEQETGLAAELASVMRLQEQTKEGERRAAGLKEKIAALQERLKTVETLQPLALAHRKYRAQIQAKEARTALLSRLETERERLKGLLAKAEALSKEEEKPVTEEDVRQAEANEKELFAIENRREQIRQEAAECARLLESQRKKAKLRGMAAFAACFVLFCVAAILLRRAIGIIGIWSLLLPVLGLAAGGAAFALLRKPDAKLDEKLQNLEKNTLDLERRSSALRSYSEAFVKQFGVGTLAELSVLAEKQKNRTQALDEAKRQAESCKAGVEKLEESLAGLPEEQELPEEASAYTGPGPDELAAEAASLRRELEDLQHSHYELTLTLAKQSSAARSAADIASDLETLRENGEVLQRQYEACQRAGRWLARAHEEIKQNYAPRLNRKTAEIFSTLTAGKYRGVKLGEDFTLNYQNENNEIVEAGYLSRGACDLLYIALRFAAAGVLAEGKIPPVILDDAFSQLDDKRASAAAEYMQNSGEFEQVLYFTCHRETAARFPQAAVHSAEL